MSGFGTQPFGVSPFGVGQSDEYASFTPAVETPHLVVPFTLGVRAAVLEQDTEEEITQCVEVLLATPVGSRPEAPEYGVEPLAFGDLDAAEIAAAVDEWEPRVDVLVDTRPDLLERFAANVRVDIDPREPL